MSMARAVAGATLLAVAAGQAAPTCLPSTCKYDSQMGASWDISSLISSTDYTWFDQYDAYTTNSTYVFNIGTNVINVPLACQGIPITGAPAYQITTSGNSQACYYLGLDLTRSGAKNPIFGLIDATNPAAGFTMKYIGGQFDNGCGPGNRVFTLILNCAPIPFPLPGVRANSSFIDEISLCNYQAYSWSSMGCPLQCPRANGGQVCGGNGICAYDTSLSSARCYCYDNWREADCMTPAFPVPVGTIAGATIGGILLGVALMAGVVMALRFWRTRTVSPAADAVDGFYAAK